jgi:3-oxoacyl-[acyl-carrier-protein] synthase II
MTRRRVVITGLGAVTPLGLSVDVLWQGLSSGRCGISPITAFDPVGLPCRLAGQVPPYQLRDYIPKSSRKAAKLMSRDIELVVMAADQALRHSGLVTKGIDPEHVTIDPQRTAVNLGAGLISCDLVELAPAVAASVTEGTFNLKRFGKEGLEYVTPLWLLKYLPNMLACHVSIIHDIQGPSNSITCAEASGLLAIAEARQVLERNHSDVALAGGAEAKVNPIVMLRQCLIKRATEQYNDQPDQACRPFDAQASGSVFGEAGGVVILEALDTAQQRAARILAEIVGVGQSCSIWPQYEALEPNGTGICIAVQKALDEAGIAPEDLDLIIPHGTGIGPDDQAEAIGLQAALGDAAEHIPTWPTKSMLSNTGAAAGVVDVIAAVSAMVAGTIPAAKNVTAPRKGCRLQIPRQPLKTTIRYALCCTYTYGGQCAALVLKNPLLGEC